MDEQRFERTTDQRLDAIVESLELLAKMQQTTERQITRLGRYVRVIVQDREARLLALEGGEDE